MSTYITGYPTFAESIGGDAAKKIAKWCDFKVSKRRVGTLDKQGYDELLFAEETNEDTLGKKLAEESTLQMRYCGEEKQWYYFNDTIWTPDSTGYIQRVVSQFYERFIVEKISSPAFSRTGEH